LEEIQEVFPEGVPLSHFYDKKMKEFFELRLGSMSMAEYEKKFLGFVKVCWFYKR
jgi:hypothetical protein